MTSHKRGTREDGGLPDAQSEHSSDELEGDTDFPSVQHSLELDRRIRERFSARTWLLNAAGILLVIALVIAIYLFSA